MLFSMYIFIALSLSPYDVCFKTGSSSYCYIPLSLSLSPALSIYLYISLHRPYSFDVPWDIWIPGRDTTKALAHLGS